MAMKVYGQPSSSATRRVLVALEKGLDYDQILIDLYTGQHKKEPFILINPFGQVPGLQDGDLNLFESRAITSYIAHAYADKGTPLISEDPKKRAIIGVWLEVEAQKFNVAAQPLSYELYLKPDEAVVEERQAELAAVLDIYEARLGKSKYLGGDDFSMADLRHIPILDNLHKTKVKALFHARPAVAAWAATLLARPTSLKINAA